MMKFNLLCLEIQRRETETEKDKTKQTNNQTKQQKKKEAEYSEMHKVRRMVFYIFCHTSPFTFRTSNFTLQMFLEYSRFCFMRDMWTAR